MAVSRSASAGARAASAWSARAWAAPLHGHFLRDGVGLGAPLFGFGRALLGGGRAGLGGGGALFGGGADGLDLGFGGGRVGDCVDRVR